MSKTTEEAIAAAATSALDHITSMNTAFPTFRDMIEAPGNYFPSIRCHTPALRLLADAYDQAQELRGDNRRAYRGK